MLPSDDPTLTIPTSGTTPPLSGTLFIQYTRYTRSNPVLAGCHRILQASGPRRSEVRHTNQTNQPLQAKTPVIPVILVVSSPKAPANAANRSGAGWRPAIIRPLMILSADAKLTVLVISPPHWGIFQISRLYVAAGGHGVRIRSWSGFMAHGMNVFVI
jgi:hypothetical protein